MIQCHVSITCHAKWGKISISLIAISEFSSPNKSSNRHKNRIRLFEQIKHNFIIIFKNLFYLFLIKSASPSRNKIDIGD